MLSTSGNKSVHSFVTVAISDCWYKFINVSNSIIGILAFSFLHLAVCQLQDTCMDAFRTLQQNCPEADDNPQVACTGKCRGYYDDFINNCPPEVSLV